MQTEAQKRAKAKYAAKCDRLIVDFYPTEKALYDHLCKQPAKQTYIKDLIRKDMKKTE